MTASSLIVSYSGIRGIVGESLTEEVACRYGRAYARLLAAEHAGPAPVLLARDTRGSGPMLMRGIVRGLGTERELVDLGVVPTPTLQFSMRPFAAAGAVCVTASHNPGEWNGMKFFLGPDNTVLDGAQTERLCALASAVADEEPARGVPEGAAAEREARAARVPLRNAHAEAVARHVEAVCAQVHTTRIRSRGFRVALDAAGGAGAEAMLALLDALGCRGELVQAARESEPVPEHLGALCAAVRAGGCAVGFAQDLDADRLVLVTEQGEAPGEERTLVLVVDHLLSRFGGGRCSVVKNVSTTRAVDDVVGRHGAALVETRVGEINLSRALGDLRRRGGIAFGGEGNGGVIYPEVSLGRDSLVAAALVLECLATGPSPLSARLAGLPGYAMKKHRVPRASGEPLAPLLERIAGLFPDGSPSRLDGLKITFADGSWVGVRPSNTEPILRVVAESRSGAWVEEVLGRVEAVCAVEGGR